MDDSQIRRPTVLNNAIDAGPSFEAILSNDAAGVDTFPRTKPLFATISQLWQVQSRGYCFDGRPRFTLDQCEGAFVFSTWLQKRSLVSLQRSSVSFSRS